MAVLTARPVAGHGARGTPSTLSSIRTAPIYQRGCAERGRLIAAGMSKLADTERRLPKSSSGTQLAAKAKRAP